MKSLPLASANIAETNCSPWTEHTHLKGYGDGSSGEVVVEPCMEDVPRKRGAAAGLGLSEVPDLPREEQLAKMRAGEIGALHSWELVTAVDGPGTRLTIFFSGCPLKCQYCHNPDTLTMRKGTLVLAEDVLDKISSYKPIFDVTGGGVTFSGGEPMLQSAFLKRLLRGCKEKNIHTCIDVTGFLGANADQEMLDNLDLVLLDVKSGDEKTYREVTGRPLAPTLAFGDRLAATNKRMWIRFVLVPGLTDAPENIEKVAQYVSQWQSVERVEVLPFHQMARDKWRELGLKYQLENTQPPTKTETAKAQEIFRSYGLEVY